MHAAKLALRLACSQFLHTHTAGTPLGDPIEIGAAAAVLVEGHNARRVQQPLALSASKSWVGHSGATQVTYALLEATC